jgi:hypothetical protein
MARWRFVVGAGLLLAGCAPLAGVGSWAVAAALGSLLLLGWAPRSQAQPPMSRDAGFSPQRLDQPPGPPGPPMPRPVCIGWEHKTCSNGRINISCCPKNVKCNYAQTGPFTPCGYNSCVPGKDIGQCPPRQPNVLPNKTKETCGSQWAKACVAGKVTEACIMMVPTNYGGPPMNPRFTTCGEDRCTTLALPAACEPTAKELPGDQCKGTWSDTCIGGEVVKRCLPKPAETYASTKFAMCDDKRCAIGPKSSCR